VGPAVASTLGGPSTVTYHHGDRKRGPRDGAGQPGPIDLAACQALTRMRSGTCTNQGRGRYQRRGGCPRVWPRI